MPKRSALDWIPYDRREFLKLSATAGVAASSLVRPAGVQVSADDDPNRHMKQLRKQATQRRRRIIFNNDGGDYQECEEATPEAVLKTRMAGLPGSNVDSIFYCTTMGFNLFTHNSDVSEVYPPAGQKDKNNSHIIKEIIDQGTDMLELAVNFCRKNDIEILWSMRINDEHDSWSPEDVSQWKKDHPEYLFGAADRRPPYGPWSGVDYALPEVREHALRIVQDVCLRYDIDGIELDFFRQLICFRTVAWGQPAGQEERDSMTDFLRRVRTMLDEIARKRNRPLLIAVRVPDSVGFSKALGLDLATWLKDDLIDIMVVGGYFWLQPWERSVELGHKFNVPVYPSLDGSRIGDPHLHVGTESATKLGMAIRQVRRSNETYRAHALGAWAAGADGIYLFNFNYLLSNREDYDFSDSLWKDLGDPQKLAEQDKIYHVSAMGSGHPSINRYLPGGDRWLVLPTLCPDHPVKLPAGNSHITIIDVGDDLNQAIDDGLQPQVKLNVQVENLASETDLSMKLNGQILSNCPLSWKGHTAGYHYWQEYDVNPKRVKKGANKIEITLVATSETPCILHDAHLRIDF